MNIKYPIIENIPIVQYAGFNRFRRTVSEQIQLLFNIDSYSMACVLFKVADIIGDSLSLKVDNKIYFSNLAFIIIEEKDGQSDDKEEPCTNTLSKNSLLKQLDSGRFISIYDDINTNKRSFVDCIINRNTGLEKLYYSIRKSIPLILSKRQAKTQLNVLTVTTNEKFIVLQSRKNINSIGLLNRFIFIDRNGMNTPPAKAGGFAPSAL